MASLRLIDIFGTSDIGSRQNGLVLREKIEIALSNSDAVILDFGGINLVTQGFIDEALGVIIRRMGISFQKRIYFQNCNELVKTVITLVATYSLTMMTDASGSAGSFSGGQREEKQGGIEACRAATV